MSVDGYFDININTPLGEKFATLHLVTNGNDLSGEFITSKTNFPIKGNVKGNRVDFTTQISMSIGEINAQITGEISSDAFIGDAKIALFGKLPIKGSRKAQS